MKNNKHDNYNCDNYNILENSGCVSGQLIKDSGNVYYTNETEFNNNDVNYNVSYAQTDNQYPVLPNTLGVVYVEDGEIKCRTLEGEDIILGNMKDNEETVSTNIIAIIAKRLLQKDIK